MEILPFGRSFAAFCHVDLHIGCVMASNTFSLVLNMFLPTYSHILHRMIFVPTLYYILNSTDNNSIRKIVHNMCSSDTHRHNVRHSQPTKVIDWKSNPTNNTRHQTNKSVSSRLTGVMWLFCCCFAWTHPKRYEVECNAMLAHVGSFVVDDDVVVFVVPYMSFGFNQIEIEISVML